MRLADLVAQVRNSVVRIEAPGSQGSGVLVADCRVVTNAHVVDGATLVSVIGGDGLTYKGRVVRRNVDRDLAVIAADCCDLPILGHATCEDVRDGDDVFALGFPLGLDLTVTRGIVSSRARRYKGKQYVQTDAAISPGSSGGALLNSSALLIGINTFLLTGGQSLNFAIPADEAVALASSTMRLGNESKVACPRCDQLVVLAERYCASCGALVLTDENAALSAATTSAPLWKPKLDASTIGDSNSEGSCAFCGAGVPWVSRYCPGCGTSKWKGV